MDMPIGKSALPVAGGTVNRSTEIGHVLLLDLVGFSKLPTDLQSDYLSELQDIVSGIEIVRQSRAAAEVICLPTGDGMALVFFNNPIAPAQCAIGIALKMQEHPRLRLRMGIHSGPVQRLRDLNGTENVAGMGINIAQRVMDCGDAGHILLSKAAAGTLLELSDWAPYLKDLGEFRVKHGIRVNLYNLVHDQAGNPHKPTCRRLLRIGSETRWITTSGVPLVLTLAMITTNWQWLRYRLTGLPSERYVALLPFERGGGDPADKALSDGLAGVMNASLAQAAPANSKLWVAPADDVRRLGVKTVADASGLLGATLVVNGKFERRGDQVYVTLRLIDPVRHRDVATRTIQGDAARLEEFSDLAAKELAKLVGGSPAAQVAAVSGRGTDAYQSYLDGEGSLHSFNGPPAVEQAIASFQKAIQVDPSFSQAVSGLAEAYLAKYRETRELQWLARADEEARKALALPHPGAQLPLTLGLVERETGHPDAAIGHFRRALEMEPGNIEAMRNLAGAYQESGRRSEAETAYQAAVRARPVYWPAHSGLATFYANSGRYKEAEASFRMVVQLAPQNPLGYRNLGGLYQLMGRQDEAIAMLRKSIELRPTAAAYNNLGAVLSTQKRFGEAVKAMEQAVHLAENDVILRYSLADVLWLLPERRNESLASYRSAADLAQAQLTANPVDARLDSALAVCLARLGDAAAAQKRVRQSLRLEPKNPAVRFKAARVFAITGLQAEAARTLSEALSMGYPRGDVEQYPELAALQRQSQ